ncbi:MAG: Mrp/NBP35 family ATP-binding protein [Spirochaetes bacterium]|nr:Mrp/NBP35 family ATP-binding protein [Spirochaetota bacterium]
MNNNDKEFNELLKEENLRKIKYKIVVMSGKGGVGKSTVSTNLAYSFVLSGAKVGILDVDIHGPSIAKLTGIEGKELTFGVNQRPKPIEATKNLFVVTIASMIENSDDPIIWRGPMKMNAIKQFLSDIEWPKLDYLIIDCPPGTGDEPLSVIQLLKKVDGSIIVSTPQDIAFLDARKTINFSRQLNVPILGIIENMAGFVCPKCGEKINIFKSGGAEKACKDFNVKLLGQIPIDTDIVDSGDNGKAYVYYYNQKEGAIIYNKISEQIMNSLGDRNEITNNSRGQYKI